MQHCLYLSNAKFLFCFLNFPIIIFTEGKIVKLAEQSIHIVVLGFSSATIIEEDIREEFSYKVVSEWLLLCL